MQQDNYCVDCLRCPQHRARVVCSVLGSTAKRARRGCADGESGPVLYVRSSAQVVHVQYAFDTGIRTGGTVRTGTGS